MNCIMKVVDEYGRIGFNTAVLKIPNHDEYLVEDVMDLYNKLVLLPKPKGSKKPRYKCCMEVTKGNRKPMKQTLCNVYSNDGQELMNQIVDEVSGLAVKYPNDTLHKLNPAILGT